MSEIVPVYNEKSLLEYFQWLRLSVAKDLNDKNIEENKSIEEDKITVSGTFKNFAHFFKRELHQYDDKSVSLAADISRFNEQHPCIISKEEAVSISDSISTKDKTGLKRLLVAVSVILDDEYSYKYEKDGLMSVSRILYGNENEILLIKKRLEDNYNAISPKSLSSVQKGALVGVAVLSLAGIAVMPVLLGAGAGASAAATTAALAAHGFGDMQIGLGIISLESLALSAALTGITYGGMKLYNSEKVKSEFRRLDPEKNALYLAIQCTYIQRIRAEVSNDEFSKMLELLLKNIGTLKSDVDYCLFVENENPLNNTKKMKSFHKFDDRLVKILGL